MEKCSKCGGYPEYITIEGGWYICKGCINEDDEGEDNG